ncbi:hypothetical protein SZ25_00136 [Candidatus Arcanobacter lacustris]|uniref:Uncharacterized protein n=1 Tax=Candidatus Arcanibacter lacustris TaxID=1607817 RepID=A0A0F5MQ22_9RICK|nr:hypothetical protein SZ25_00136 [Candidatus Arcanobacter lacustris]
MKRQLTLDEFDEFDEFDEEYTLKNTKHYWKMMN